MTWPYKYLPPGQKSTEDYERAGDRTIKACIEIDADIPTAMLTLILKGTRRWYATYRVLPEDPQLIKDATEEWRKSCDVGYQFSVDYLTSTLVWSSRRSGSGHVAGRSVVIRPKSPAPRAPLGEVGALGAECGVPAVAGIEPRGVGELIEYPGTPGRSSAR